MTPYYDHERWPGLMAAIKASPDDDLPRLVAADHIEEYGDEERAKVIRWEVAVRRNVYLDNIPWKIADRTGDDFFSRWRALGGPKGLTAWANRAFPPPASGHRCDMFFRRGFVSLVHGPLHWLHWGPCPFCGGQGRSYFPPSWGLSDCPQCDGKAGRPGVLGDLLRREPLTADQIRVTDRRPSYSQSINSHAWYSEHVPTDGGLASLPQRLFDLLPPAECSPKSDRCQWYPSADHARLALGQAIIAFHTPEVPT